jgi:dCTP deaminase
VSALSRSSIIKAIKSEGLVVSPILSARQIGASSVDLRMGTVALVARAGAQSHVDPAGYLDDASSPGLHGPTERRQQKHSRFDVPFGASFLLHPGSLVLVPTLEWMKIPPTLQGVVTARSSWAREGLNIATATIVNPGYSGIVTLELANFGQIPISLNPGLRLAQIAFYRLEAADSVTDAKHLGGKFNGCFEPAAGNIALDDEMFVRKANPSARRA